jgi:hypothetical protein
MVRHGPSLQTSLSSNIKHYRDLGVEAGKMSGENCYFHEFFG